MNNSNKNIGNPVTITYSHTLRFAGKLLGWRKKELFDLSGATPLHIPKSAQGWWVTGRDLLTKTTAQQLTTATPHTVDISQLQWYNQINLTECFNL